MKNSSHKRFVIVRDDFYGDPLAVYRAALTAEYYESEGYTGFHSRNVYHEPGIRRRIEQLLGVKVTRWDTDPYECNGVFYQGFARGERKETPGVHSDTPFDDITLVVYLTPGLPADCGTSLWQHKRTGLSEPPTVSDARRLKCKLSELRDELERDSKHRARWIETDRLGYRFNRMVAYPSGLLHSATNHYGSSMADGRLFQTFRIGVDWSTFKG
jgi:Family of unknown function (DUF6445)